MAQNLKTLQELKTRHDRVLEDTKKLQVNVEKLNIHKFEKNNLFMQELETYLGPCFRWTVLSLSLFSHSWCCLFRSTETLKFVLLSPLL